MITSDTCAVIFMFGSEITPILTTGSLRTGTITQFTVILAGLNTNSKCFFKQKGDHI